MNPPTERELRSLVTLLDEEDPRSFELVRRQILSIGEPVLPFLDEVRAGDDQNLAARADAMTRAVRFQKTKDEFARLARSPEPDLETGTLLLARFAYPGSTRRSIRPGSTAWPKESSTICPRRPTAR